MKKPGFRSNSLPSRWSLFCQFALLSFFSFHQSGWCAVTTDGSLGAAIALGGPNYAITANLGRQSGNNLFHSFSQFSLVAGEKAIFSGPAGVSAIISRVTGGASSINGTISSTIAGANLYLVNPAGITFGPNAALDVSGSFHASTADYVVLGTTGRFPSNPVDSLNLTVDPPTAFGFLNPPSPITVNGSFLSVPQGKNISLSGGDITTTDANLWSYGGLASLASLASSGEVNIGTAATIASAMGAIRLTDTRGPFAGPVYTTPGMAGFPVANLDASGNGGGKIVIRGSAFYMTDAKMYNDTYGAVPGAAIDINMSGRVELTSSSIGGWGASGTASGASISLNGGDIVIRDSSVITNSLNQVAGSNISLKSSGSLSIAGISWVSADATGGGKAGNLSLEGATITIGSGSTVSSSAPVLGAGATSGAGSLAVSAAESLSLTGNLKSENVEGTSGNITISAPVLTISGEGLISGSLLANPSAEARRSGGILIDAKQLSLLDNGRIETRVLTSNSGSSGDIRIKTGTLSLSGCGAISSSINSASGTGGSIRIDADTSISVASVPSNQFREKGSIASDSTNGNAGHITLNAQLVSITGGGSLTTIAQGGNGRGGDISVTASDRILIDGGFGTAGNFKRSMIATDTLAQGSAGSISLSAPLVTVAGGSLVSSLAESGSSGNGGSIAIKAGQSVTVQGGGSGRRSQISVETRGQGDAGAITLNSPLLTLADGGIITAAAMEGSRGNGGLIAVSAGNRISISGTADQAGISGNAASSGNGAQIQISAPAVEVLAGGYISADTGPGSSGKGGDVSIKSQTALVSGGRISSSTKGSGSAGSIKLDGKDLFIRDGGIVSTSAETGSSGRGGSGGNIGITIDGPMKVQGVSASSTASQVTSRTYGRGDGGTIRIASGSLDVSNGGVISTSAEVGSSGNGGSIAIQAGQSVTVQGGSNGKRSQISVETRGQGDAGAITLDSPLLTLADGGVISAAALEGSRGNGGLISVTAANRISVSGTADQAGISGNAASSGNGAQIQISAPAVEVLAGGYISADTGPGSSGKGGDVSIKSQTALISGGRISSSTKGSGSAGSIKLDGKDLFIRDGGIVSTSAETGSSGSGGNIGITIDGPMKVQGGSASSTSSQVTSRTYGRGDGGTIQIASGSLDVSNGGVISTSAESGSSGNGGSIAIQAGQSVTVQGGSNRRRSQISVETRGQGDAGAITLDSPLLTLADGGVISAAALEGSRGNGGLISVTAGNRISISGTADQAGISGNAASSGNGAQIQISAPAVEVLAGGYISADTGPASSGKGGDVSIKCQTALVSGGRVSSSTKGTGSAGSIMLDGTELSLREGGIVSTSAESGSSGSGGSIALNTVDFLTVRGASAHISSDTAGTGAGGRISVETSDFQLLDSGSLRTRSTGTGNAGDITVTASTLLMKGGALLDSSSSGLSNSTALSKTEAAQPTGSAGNVTVSILKDARINGSMVTTQSATSEGGNISFSASAGVTIDHGELSASATAGIGNGGNVTLSGGTIILNSGKVTAQAERGRGGNLDIHAGLLIASGDSVISASSRFGTQGTVLIDAPAVDIGGALARQPGDFISIDAFLPKRCLMPDEEEANTLLMSGGEAPSAPAALLPLITPLADSNPLKNLRSCSRSSFQEYLSSSCRSH